MNPPNDISKTCNGSYSAIVPSTAKRYCNLIYPNHQNQYNTICRYCGEKKVHDIGFGALEHLAEVFVCTFYEKGQSRCNQ